MSLSRLARTRYQGARSGRAAETLACKYRISNPNSDGAIEFRREALPPLAALEVEWRGLEPAAAPSFFTSWYWIGTFLTALPEGKRPDLLRGSLRGETVALALIGAKLVRRRYGLIRSRALFLNETGDPDYDVAIEHNGLLVATAYRRAASDALIRWFAEYGAREADELHVGGSMQPLPGDDLAQRGLYREQSAVPSYWVALELLVESDGELYPVLSSNARQQLRRAFRHFEKFGKLRLDRASDRGEARKFFAELKELHITTWQSRGKPHAFSRPFFEAFHQELIERHVADGVVQLLRASAGSRLIGYLYNFRLSDRVYAYQSGFAYDERRARPGAVAHALAIRDAYHYGATAYDFLAGRNRLEGELCERERADVLGSRSTAASGVSGRTPGASRQASAANANSPPLAGAKRGCLRDGKAIEMRRNPKISPT